MTEEPADRVARAIQDRLNRDWGVMGEDGLQWEDALAAADAACGALNIIGRPITSGWADAEYSEDD